VLSESGVPFGIFEIVILVLFSVASTEAIYIGGIKGLSMPIEILFPGALCL
jgi:hypothetical protein